MPSALRLDFDDKYRIWADFVRGPHQRFFVPTAETFKLGGKILVEVAVKSISMPLVVSATVNGHRQKSDKFPAGVFLAFTPQEVDKVRRLIGLGQVPDPLAQTLRAHPRIEVELPIRLELQSGAQDCLAQNVSKSGVLVRTKASLFESERIDVKLQLAGSAVPFRAEVVWTNEEQGTVGLHFVDPPQASVEALAAFIETRSVQEKKAQAELSRLVVVADDEPDILKFLTIALTKHGYTVQQAKRGDEALELIRKVKPSLALLDVLMPGIDGVDICKLMRADARLADVPVVFLSALDESRLHQAASESGATDYLTKPVDLNALINLVGKYLRD